MLEEQNNIGMHIINNNNYGSILISEQDIISLIQQNLETFFSLDVKLSKIRIITSSDGFPIIQVLITINSETASIWDELDLIANAIDVYIQSNLGLRILGTQVGFEYDSN